MFHNKYGKVFLLFFLLTSISSACEGVQTSPKYTVKGTSTKTPFHTKSTFTPTREPPPTFTPSKTPTPTEAVTSTSTATELVIDTETLTAEPASLTPLPATSTASVEVKKSQSPDQTTVKVSITTNCRTGPGISYSKLSPLFPGKTAALIGRDSSYTYWIIKDPGQTGKNCWLWGYYATTSGNTKNLKVFSAPDQPSTKGSSTPATKTAKPSSTPTTPLPTETPNLTPGTPTNTPQPATATPVPSNTPIPSSSYCSYTSVLLNEEERIKQLINQARQDRGLPKLKIDVRLVNAAREHGRDMTCHGTYSHTSTDGRKAYERISVALGHGPNWCYNHCCCSEIFYGGYITPESAFDWWMNHPSQDSNYTDNIHKRTILSRYSTKLGVGVIYYQHNGTIRKFYTVDFAKP